MKLFTPAATACLFIAICAFYFSCSNKDKAITIKPAAIPTDILAKLKELGYSTDNVLRAEGGYLVEGDIFMADGDFKKARKPFALDYAHTEQYRTYNLVTGLPRTLTVYVDPTLPAVFTAATDEAIARYNARALLLTFQRVTTAASIMISGFFNNATPVLGSSGFPTAAGDPFNQISLNTFYYPANSDQAFLATTIAHEIGHCIGMRHTDYFDHSISCHVAGADAPSSIGAVYIPGTPSGVENGSWMLACTDIGVNRPFTIGDITALNYLYGPPPPCVGEGYAVINGVCELGYRVNVSSNYLPAWNEYECIYYFVFSDGSYSQTYSQWDVNPCAID